MSEKRIKVDCHLTTKSDVVVDEKIKEDFEVNDPDTATGEHIIKKFIKKEDSIDGS